MEDYSLDSPDKGWKHTVGSCENSTEFSAYINSRKFLIRCGTISF